jgi:hypothetical protein
MPLMPLISRITPPSAFLLAVVTGLLILVANMVIGFARERTPAQNS